MRWKSKTNLVMTEIQVSWQVLRWWKMLASSNALSDRLAERSHDYATHAVYSIAQLTKSSVSILVAHYCTSGLNGQRIYHMFRHIVRILELCDIRVRTSISNDAGSLNCTSHWIEIQKFCYIINSQVMEKDNCLPTDQSLWKFFMKLFLVNMWGQ